ncbi:MAG TPA: DUF4340 domain-containing protein [Candidatus Limnocylindrales bacterium]|nr:DUF4340 domain-containing protein [Candidatus Limnocylindrales bacterium]
MSFVRTIILVVIAAALGAWLFFVEGPKALLEAKKDYLIDVDPADVEKIHLVYTDQPEIEIVKEAGNWKLTKPVAYPAEKSVVENFLNTVKDAKIERRLEKNEAGALSSYGLEGPNGSQARIELTLEGGKPLPAVLLGIATPVGYQAFARRDGSDEVLVIPLLLQSSAKKTPSELRAKAMFPGVDSTGIKTVTIEKPGEKIEVERKSEFAWEMKSPVNDTADQESMRSMLDSLATIDAVGFYDGAEVDRKAFGLDEGATHFRAQREDGSQIAFTIGKAATDQPAGNYFERESDHQVVKAPDWVAQKFMPGAAELRDKRFLSCKLDEVRSLRFSMAGDTFTLAREAPGKPWTIDPPAAGEVLNQRIVDNALNGLAAARADEVVADAPPGANLHQFGLDAPVARLEVGGANGSCGALSASPGPANAEQPEPGTQPGGPKYYVKSDSRTAVLRATQHEYSRIATRRAEFVESAKAPDAAKGAAAGDKPAAPSNPDDE